jgi:thiol-disulfide isomerase/thioredoxin
MLLRLPAGCCAEQAGAFTFVAPGGQWSSTSGGAWCGPCLEEMSGLQQIHQQLLPQGVSLLGVDIRDERDTAADFMCDRAISYPSIVDDLGRALTALRGFPATPCRRRSC